MKYNDEQEELDHLEYRYLNTRAKRTAKPKEVEPPKETKAEPEIHVHVDMPEVKPCSPKKWVFKHKYDNFTGRLIETTATCE